MPSGVYTRTEIGRQNLSKAHLGQIPWNKGIPNPICGDKCNLWLGDDVGYSGVHKWIYKHKGKPSKCEICGTTKAKKFEWCNVDHTYRRVLDDYFRACTSCHRKYDYGKFGRY